MNNTIITFFVFIISYSTVVLAGQKSDNNYLADAQAVEETLLSYKNTIDSNMPLNEPDNKYLSSLLDKINAGDYSESFGSSKLYDVQGRIKRMAIEINYANKNLKLDAQNSISTEVGVDTKTEESPTTDYRNNTTTDMLSVLVIVISIMTVIGVFLGLTKRVVFYNDYNDLMLSMAVIAVPVLAALLSSFLPPYITGAVFYFSLAAFLLAMIKRTYAANNNNILIAITLVSSKIALSILYMLHLYMAMTNKNRTNRRVAAFILIILTPLMLALVHDKETGDSGILAKRRLRFW